MQIVIDIPEELYRQVKDPCVECGYIATECYNAIYRGSPLPISDNATNGDVIKVMFPELGINSPLRCNNLDWWNAPYQKGDNE